MPSRIDRTQHKLEIKSEQKEIKNSIFNFKFKLLKFYIKVKQLEIDNTRQLFFFVQFVPSNDISVYTRISIPTGGDSVL